MNIFSREFDCAVVSAGTAAVCVALGLGAYGLWRLAAPLEAWVWLSGAAVFVLGAFILLWREALR